MSNRETMQQALEALENIDKAMPFPVGKQAITALKAALEQPEQEPVAIDWQRGSVPLGGNSCSVVSREIIPFEFRQPAAQPAQEPTPWRDMVVVTLVREGIDKHRARELADHFAARPEQEPVKS